MTRQNEHITVTKDHRDLGDAEFARGLQAQMAIDDFAVAAGEYRDLESELADAAAHAIHSGIVLAGVAGVENEFVDWPVLDVLGHRLTDHALPHEEFSLY
jgi:hypothetical protein